MGNILSSLVIICQQFFAWFVVLTSNDIQCVPPHDPHLNKNKLIYMRIQNNFATNGNIKMAGR